MIVLGDARSHETGKQGNRPANPGQEKLPILRSISSGRIDTEVCNVTAGASSPATYGPTRPRAPEQSRRPPARTRCAQPATFNPSGPSATTAAAASTATAICFSIGMIPTKAAA
ncbi:MULTISPECIES: hypothetical protein [unclassified Sphingopyxis]|uniref:hypothetical protein n=1 Tax=unclassified Sphingopyxis TaxID=2614943 RepID=UPI002855204E|nr:MULTISPECIES: hypothetical protein [unclassified Sphingopyxis]MDR7227851.1 hypothetical protein [Sphingopyxis sp. BE259]